MTLPSFLDFPSMPFPSEQVVPDVWLSGEYLCWRPGGANSVRNFRRFLYDFTKLTSPAAVLSFAKRFGPLGLCEHGFPVMRHRRDRVLCPPEYLATRDGLEIRERVSTILAWAGQAAAVLGVAAKVHRGAAVTDREWRAAGLSGPSVQLPLPSSGVEAKQLLAAVATFWLHLGDPRPRVIVDASGRLELKFISGDRSISGIPPRLDVAAAQLANNLNIAVLSMQLAAAVCGGAGLATCSGCGVLYVPNRIPVEGRRHFCSPCGVRAAWRLSKREARKSGERSGTQTQRA